MVLRISTAGSVDDGKSTLIGRLLYDTKTVFEDQLAAVQRASKRYGDGSTNLALLTDGLRAEREQGITIDVAYRYFATPNRTFIVADTPGHAQYTRNMVTGASVSDVAIVLVDARVGLTTQSRRHLFIVSLLGVSDVVLAVNKMDLVDFQESTFDDVVKSANDYLAKASHAPNVTAIPISALHGDNVVRRSESTPWYSGPVLLEFLETVQVGLADTSGARLRVQNVIRPHSRDHHDYRGVAGRLSGGGIAVGDDVVIYPVGLPSTLASISLGGDDVQSVESGRSVTVTLSDDIDVGRGDVLVRRGTFEPLVTDSLECDVCWMTDGALDVGSRWVLKIGTRVVPAVVRRIQGAYNIESAELEAVDSLVLNDIGVVQFDVGSRVVCDPYSHSRRGGSAILIDEANGSTVAALMIRGAVRD